MSKHPRSFENTSTVKNQGEAVDSQKVGVGWAGWKKEVKIAISREGLRGLKLSQ